MLGDLVKLLELLVSILKGSGDHKRAHLAKDLRRLHQEIADMVERGRAILQLVSEHNPYPDGRAVQLLSEQLGVLDTIKETLTTGAIGDVLQVHLPEARRHLNAYIDAKKNRVCIRLDQLVSDGSQLQPDEWIDSMENKIGQLEVPSLSPAWSHALTFYAMVLRTEGEIDLINSKPLAPNTRFVVEGEDREISMGHELLNRIAAANEQVRAFLVEKFKFEDIL
jgi:hypothetical protein